MYLWWGDFFFFILSLSSIFFLIFHPRLCFIAARRLRTCIPNHISPIRKCWAIGRFVLLLLSSIRRAVCNIVYIYFFLPPNDFISFWVFNGPHIEWAFFTFFCWERMTFKGPAVLSSQDKKIDPFCRWNDKMPIDSGDRNRSRFIGSILPFSKRLCYPPVETRENFFFFRPFVDFHFFSQMRGK